MPNKEIYISIDIEADGPIPGAYSMMSLGAVAFTADGEELGSFSRNLERLPDAGQDPDTMAWWKTKPEAYALATANPYDAELVMREFSNWVESYSEKGKPVAVCYPASFDFMFVYWYLIYFTGRSPFGFSGVVDIKSYAAALLKKFSFREVTKKNMPKEWFKGLPKHTHEAVADAREQGLLFMRMWNESW